MLEHTVSASCSGRIAPWIVLDSAAGDHASDPSILDEEHCLEVLSILRNSSSKWCSQGEEMKRLYLTWFHGPVLSSSIHSSSLWAKPQCHLVPYRDFNLAWLAGEAGMWMEQPTDQLQGASQHVGGSLLKGGVMQVFTSYSSIPRLSEQSWLFSKLTQLHHMNMPF